MHFDLLGLDVGPAPPSDHDIERNDPVQQLPKAHSLKEERGHDFSPSWNALLNGEQSVIKEVCQPGTRALAWRIMLQVIPKQCPPQDWSAHLQSLRAEYLALKGRHIPDISLLPDPLLNASHYDEGWSGFYKHRELVACIQRDVARIYPAGCDEDHFSAPHLQEAMVKVLTVWAKEHPLTSYRQGMHELLVPLVLALEAESSAMGKTTNFPLQDLELGGHVLESDLFWLFELLMRSLELYYKHDDDVPPIVGICNRVQGDILGQHDSRLCRHLEEQGCLPQLYGMRYLRLMFGREFSFPSLFNIWDFLLSEAQHADVKQDGEGLRQVAELFIVCMLIHIREPLLNLQESGNLFHVKGKTLMLTLTLATPLACLSLLMKYPQRGEGVVDLYLAIKRGGKTAGKPSYAMSEKVSSSTQHLSLMLP
ncbi:unnamed protein product [Chrysoparadoxa australica]